MPKIQTTLRAQLSLAIMLLVLFAVALISFLANHYIGRQFEAYVREQERLQAADIALTLSHQYTEDGWEEGFIHGVGMAALSDGYIIKVYDAEGRSIWDAENHDMTLCMQVMDEISARMQEQRPEVAGTFTSGDYVLTGGGKQVGSVTISYYGPYFLRENDFRFLTALNTVLISSGLLSLILALVTGWILARRLAFPIKRTAEIAQQIAEGNYNIRFGGQTKTKELSELTQAIDHLAGALAEQESLRQRLTSDVAHELRTPLTVAQSHLEAMSEGVWEPTRERLQSCYEELSRLGTLVADLEKLAHVESADFTLSKTSVALADIAYTVSSNLATEMLKKELTFTIEGVATVAADKDRISQVVFNLLTNAIKYTPPGGQIAVTLEETAESAILTVADTGIGILEAELSLVFERFYRTDKSRDRLTGGAGIGLTIVKAIVTAHGGTVTCESRAGAGACFTVTIQK
jgi:signal transduction histidine kinase